MRRGLVIGAAGIALALIALASPDQPGAAAGAAANAADELAPAPEAAPVADHAHAHPQIAAHADHGTHPLTAEHAALYRDVDLLDGAWTAAREGDYDRARALLAQHGAEYPRPEDDMREGLALLVDCMAGARADAVDRAQQFYDTRTHSMMRRRIRRHCLARTAHHPGSER
ncbi:MAG: hypothetical protein OXT09_00900 [Myxococcales bacterium]|nr:hypothetical protein [Myxococcales bacterium]